MPNFMNESIFITLNGKVSATAIAEDLENNP